MAADEDISSISTLTDFTTESENELDPSLTFSSRQFRHQGRTNRSGRTQIDHDVFEGLPIRQWRTTEGHIGPPVAAEPIVNKHAWPELPMPRDSHLLSPMSQQLLRAARAPWLFKSNTNKEDEGKENGDEDEEVKEPARGFVAKKWSQVPRHLEEPDHEFLAKRRKGLPSPYSSEANHTVIPAGPSRKTKVRKTDADGNVTVWEVLVPEGQTVEGEIIEDEATLEEAVAPVAAAPGTVVEGVGVVNADGVVVASDLVQPTPPRRRPPPPRRKPKKGPGRGKKKVQFTGAEGAAAGAVGEVGIGRAPGSAEDLGAQLQAAAAEGAVAADGEAEMADAQEGDEEDDEGEEGEEGEEGDDDEDREEGELSPTPQEATSGPAGPAPSDTQKSTEVAPVEPELTQVAPEEVQESSRHDASSSPDLPLATTSHSRSGSKTDVKPLSEQITAAEENVEDKGQDDRFAAGEMDLFGSLEKHLEKS
ncbi:MAG: hypothetical protein M1821_007805 [Bathelium mastoideum]|nr:MAG: hypothetical protein M1821_007805 [Bathelium mastoideum]